MWLADIQTEILIGFVVSSAALAILPGPDNIFVLVQSIAKGTRSGIAVVFGLISGCLVHTSLLAFGLSEVIKQSPSLFWAISLFGAGYLLYLAYQVYRSEAKISLTAKTVAHTSLWPLFKKGFVMNVLNPKVTIFFLAFFPGFLFSKTLSTVLQFYILGLLFMAVTLLVFGGIAVLAGQISDYIQKRKRVAVVLKWLQIIVFIGIAVYLLLSHK